MNINEVASSTVHYVSTDDGEYTRHNADNWTYSVGGTDYHFHLCEEIEQAFQIYIQNQDHMKSKGARCRCTLRPIEEGCGNDKG